LRANVAKQRLREGKTIIGCLLGFNSPTFVELCALAAFDFVMFDCEHGPMSVETVEGLVRAAEAAGITPLARVPHNEPSTILRFLDTGLLGVMVPHIETADDARAAVQAIKYPPVGERGLAGVRANDFGAKVPMAEYTRLANDETMFVALVESRKGVEHAAEIAAVPGVDVVQIGPSDLSMSMGHYGHPEHPEVQAAIDQIIAAATAAGKPAGSGAIRGSAALRKALDRGIRCVTYGARDLVVDSGRQLLNDVGRG
jgi:4-hydroxy-2-oxoheptanedioate aldolase